MIFIFTLSDLYDGLVLLGLSDTAVMRNFFHEPLALLGGYYVRKYGRKSNSKSRLRGS